MPHSCRAAHRCSSISCAACAWRYSLRVSRRILALEPSRVHAVTIAGAASSQNEYRHWRKSIHNCVTYRRSSSRWWPSVGFWGWWDGIGLRGVVSLGSVTPSELTSALRRHGDVRLRLIAAESVRTEVYAATRSISTAQAAERVGRYQSVKIAIEPVIIATRSIPIASDVVVEPMPILT